MQATVLGPPATPGAGVEALVRLLLHDAAFARAVAAKDGETAASAAVGVVKSHFRSFANVLRPGGAAAAGGATAPGGTAALPVLEPASPTFSGRRLSADLPARRASDPGCSAVAAAANALAGGGRPGDLRVKDRVIINANHKRFDGVLIGREGMVVHITSNGWVKVQVAGEVLDFQLRCVTPVQPRAVAGTLVSSTFGLGKGGDPRVALKGAPSRTLPRKSDVLKAVRKELTLLEEQVPWKEVRDRWRTARKGWTRRLRQADTSRDVALCVREFHDNLKTDKTSGLFAAGGPWETALLEACATAPGNHLQLQAVWDEMRPALQAWLASGTLPGGMASLDKASYERAVATYTVLQEAAMQGPEYLEQVPLDHILTSHKEVLALQHIIQRETAAAHARLQALASGDAAAAAAAAQPPQYPQPQPAELEAAASAAAAAAGGGLTEAVLLQLGKLPRLKASDAGGAASEVDTDQDAGSEATDLGDVELMEVG